jgi:septal ring factor EnvC (AmiA/AmiB activator)
LGQGSSRKLEAMASDRETLERELFLSKKSMDNLSNHESIEAYELNKIYISQSENFIALLKEQNRLFIESVKKNRAFIDSLTIKLEEKESQYEEVLRMFYRQKIFRNDWMFLFSSETFHQMWIKYRYAKQFRNFVKKERLQLISLKENYQWTNQKINEELIAIKHNKRDRELTLLHLLEKEEELGIIVNELKRKKKKIEKKIKEREEYKKVSSLKIRKENKEQFSLNPNTTVPIIDDNKPENASFIERKSDFSWPVAHGFIAERFGRRPHDLVPNVWIENNGIGVYTQPGENVKVIYKGVVKEIPKISKEGYMVIVEHGDYLTSYFTLASIFVSKGDEVSEGQIIGSMSKSNTSPPILQFEIWKGFERINPEIMLKKKH